VRPHILTFYEMLQSPSLKYQLPTDTNVYVDLLDDVDTQLMFDEWHEYSNAPTRKANSKLHLFVDWQRQPPEDQGRQVQKQVSLSPHGSLESIMGGDGGGSHLAQFSQNNSWEGGGLQPGTCYRPFAERAVVRIPKSPKSEKNTVRRHTPGSWGGVTDLDFTLQLLMLQ